MDFGPAPAAAPMLDDGPREKPRRLRRPDIQPLRDVETPQASKGSLFMIRRMFLQSLTPIAATLTMLAGVPVEAWQQLESARQDRPIPRRRAPEGQRRNALSFVRTELFFGTAKPVGVVTDEEFKAFLDEVVTPRFPDGLTVLKGDGQFKGADGITIKEDSYVVVLLYPADGHKASNRSIEFIRTEYMRQHQQESVLRVDDPFLVWVSF